MKLRTIKYVIREGFVNTWQNTLMCFASIGTVTASLIILGVFVLVGANIDFFSKEIQKNLQIEVFLNMEMKEDRISQIKNKINSFGMGEVTYVSKEEALEKLKKNDIFKGHEKLLEGYVLPPSLILHLTKAEHAENAIELLKGIKDIVPKDIKYNKEVMDSVVKFMNVIRIVSLLVMILLGATSILIISNTIRLTVFARRKEIGIMKYIGATDSFIKWPFIIESVIISTLSSVIAFLIVSKGYDAIISYLSRVNSGSNTGISTFVSFSSVSANLLHIYLIIGIGMGCLGSAISIRKYLRV